MIKVKSKMWNEIHDQYEVSKNVIDVYSGKLEVYNEVIKRKNKIFLLGTGASLNACEASKYAFSKYRGIIPYVIPAAETDYVIGNMDKDTLTILVSQSGESLETKMISQLLRDRNIEFWGMTNNPDSFLAKNANQVLLLGAGEEVSSATKTNMASLLILYMLAAGNDKDALEDINKIPEAIRVTLSMVDERIPALVEKIKDKKNTYVLGAGMSGPTARQGSLMMKEKTFIHTEGLSISDFRHGSVEVIEEGLPIIICASTPSSVKEASGHARYMRNLLADVYMIVDGQIETDTVEDENIIYAASGDNEIFSHITTTIPLQLLAEGIAAAKSYDVDGFRYLSKVVDKY